MITRTLNDFVEQHAGRSAIDRRPEGVTFELSYGCNLRCVHCANPTHRALPAELSTEEICGILTQIAALGVMTVTFTGGEPTIRPDFLGILEHSQRQGLLIQLLTNATKLTPHLLDRLERLPVTGLNVSIYGATAGRYEAMTGISGSYTQFRRGLELLAARRLPVTLRMPVTSVNVDDLAACRELAESYRFPFQYCLDITPRTDGDLTPLQYRLAAQTKAEIDQWMLGDRLAAWVPDRCNPERPFISCACGRSRFAVTPYGHMNLCVGFPTPRYDLRTGTVREGWELLKQTVDAAMPNGRDACATCDLQRFCRQGRADAWLETGDMSRCLPHFKEWAQALQGSHALIDPRRPR